MKSIRILIALLCIVVAAGIGACKTEVQTDGGSDTIKTGSDTVVVTPDTSTSSTTDTGTSTVGGAVSGAGQEVKDESVEKMVEAALTLKAGFENVTVESAPEGVIILNGTVKTEAEKMDAQATAEKTAGVNKVTNNLTIKP